MREVWHISISAGAGAALGIVAAGLFARFTPAPVAAALTALAAGGLLAWLVFDWKAAVAIGMRSSFRWVQLAAPARRSRTARLQPLASFTPFMACSARPPSGQTA